jgi:3-ketosteroid 9alpha-monooxygenase subunit B
MHSHAFFTVPVSDVVAETRDAVSLVLDVPEDLQETFRYAPGQFLTVRLAIGGKFRHRCYSLSSAPGRGEKHKITIKRVEGGLVSNQLCAEVRAGATILVQPPAGHFVPATLDTDLLLFGAGSGITPVLSILKTALAEGTGRITLFYANRDEQSVIFRDELAQLSATWPERLTVLHWLETVQGLPSAAQIAPLVRPWADAEVFICGPEPFMIGVTSALGSLGVADTRIHLERFVSLPDEDTAVAEPVAAGPAASVEVLIDGETHRLDWPRSTKLLDVMLSAGLDAPYSCRVGGCSACMCRVRAGKVHMATNLVLDERDLSEGWVLACQALPDTDDVGIEIPS